MSLQGLPFPEVVASLAQNEATGELQVRGDDGFERTFLFVEGEIRAARSNNEEERMGSWLVRQGIISEEQKALLLLKLTRPSDPSMGHLVVKMGFANQIVLDRCLQELALHIITQAAQQQQRNVAFSKGHDALPWDILPDLVTAQLILLICRLNTNRDAKRKALPPPEHYVSCSRPLEGILEEFELTPTEAFLVSRLGKSPNIKDLLGSAGMPEEQVIESLYALRLAGLVDSGPTPGDRGMRRSTSKPAVEVGALDDEQIQERERITELARRLPEFDHYSVLGLEITAARDDIELAWFACQARCNPSRVKEPHLADKKEELEAILSRLESAYEVLSSPPARRRYDRILKASAEETADTAEADDGRQKQARQEVVAANLKRADELLQLGETHLAIQLLETAADLEPRPEVLLKLARIMRGKPMMDRRVLHALRKALELDPRFIDAWLELADYWKQHRQPERQRKALERALAVEPTNETARRNYNQTFGQNHLRRLLSRFVR